MPDREPDAFLAHEAAAPAITFLMDRLLEVTTIPVTTEHERDQELLLRTELDMSGVLETVPPHQRGLVSMFAYSRAQELTDEIRELRSL